MMAWLPITGTQNYRSSDGRFVAIFQDASRGLPSFRVYPAGAKMIARNLLCVGGLPSKL